MASDSAGQQDFLEDYPEVYEQRPSAPPEPPYTKPNDEELSISYSHFLEAT